MTAMLTPAPWTAAIAQIATLRVPPARVIDTSPAACRMRGLQARQAEIRRQALRARIRATLAAGPADGMSADEIGRALTGKKASGNIYRNLDAMAAEGGVEKTRINRQDVRWKLGAGATVKP
jgi:hypothetical protein